MSMAINDGFAGIMLFSVQRFACLLVSTATSMYCC